MTLTEHQIPKSMRTPGLAALVRDALRAGLHVDGTERGLRIHGNGRDLVVAPNGWAHDPRVDSRVAKSIRAHADMRRALGLPQAPQNTP
jgi:hypothetical protein